MNINQIMSELEYQLEWYKERLEDCREEERQSWADRMAGFKEAITTIKKLTAKAKKDIY